jgi:hypothetical protein
VTNPVLQDYLEMLSLADEVHLDNSDVIAAVTLLENTGLISAGRAVEILNGQ